MLLDVALDEQQQWEERIETKEYLYVYRSGLYVINTLDDRRDFVCDWMR